MATTSCRPVTSLAMRSAASFEFAAGRDQQDAVELAGRDLGDQRREIDHGARQDRRVEMVELADIVAGDRDDLGMAVAQDRAHLARGEVEDAPAVGIGEPVAGRALGDHRREGAAVAHQMRVGLGPELGIGVACSCCLQRRAHQRQAVVAEEHRAADEHRRAAEAAALRSARRCWRAAAPCRSRSRCRRRSAGARCRPWRRCRPARPPCEMSRSSPQ